MTNDIVARLRGLPLLEQGALCEEAADEIERLRAEIARKDAALEALIVAVDWEAIPAAQGDDVERRMRILLDCANEARAALAGEKTDD